MTNSLYFLRHAETKEDESTPVRDWRITDAGIDLTRELVRSEKFGEIHGIIHSSEGKARQTAEVFAEGIDVQMYQLSGLDELSREHEGALTYEEYRDRVHTTLRDPEKSVPGWESGASALKRFEDAVRKVDIMFHRKNVLIVSHGLVLTLYFCKLKNFESIAYERWTQIKFLAWGLVREGRVLVDLV
ncbi:MAG: phosphoglycerate mutase GpmB [Candidatus Thorarchaeota archaeon AB_25]|nr:MAG: phosphoglycerate mutase GpmB [Candidatus Thorarchaeota archaeon AB_25]